MRLFISILFILVFLLSCTIGEEMQWRVNDEEVSIQLYEPNQID